MSDENVIDAEVASSPMTSEGMRETGGLPVGLSDSARKERGPVATLRMARYGVEIENGTPSKRVGMRAAGYSPSYADSSSSASVSVEKALAAKEALLPNEPTNKVINDLSKRKLAERLLDDPSDQLLVTAYKTSGDAVLATGETEQDPQEARDMQEMRYAAACRLLHAAIHYAKIGARFPDGRVTAALQRRLDELVPNKRFSMDLDLAKQITERDGLDALHTFTNQLLGDAISGYGDATDYRRARERGFPLPSVPAVRNRWNNA